MIHDSPRSICMTKYRMSAATLAQSHAPTRRIPAPTKPPMSEQDDLGHLFFELAAVWDRVNPPVARATWSRIIPPTKFRYWWRSWSRSGRTTGQRSFRTFAKRARCGDFLSFVVWRQREDRSCPPNILRTNSLYRGLESLGGGVGGWNLLEREPAEHDHTLQLEATGVVKIEVVKNNHFRGISPQGIVVHARNIPNPFSWPPLQLAKKKAVDTSSSRLGARGRVWCLYDGDNTRYWSVAGSVIGQRPVIY